MIRKVLLAIVFILPVGAVALSEYWDFLRAHVVGQVPEVPSPPASRRPWASRVDAPPLANFFRVGEQVYRGAQPDAAGMRRLEELGIRTVVNLRRFHTDDDEAAGTSMARVHINVNPFKPRREQLVAFLRVATDPNRTPLFVHCQRGIDRTGMMCAVYRMVVSGWPKGDAIDEMRRGPFGYDAIFANVVEFLWRLDVDDLRRELNGVGSAPVTAPATAPAGSARPE